MNKPWRAMAFDYPSHSNITSPMKNSEWASSQELKDHRKISHVIYWSMDKFQRQFSPKHERARHAAFLPDMAPKERMELSLTPTHTGDAV